jgi:M6 family metalloprotease-like protein
MKRKYTFLVLLAASIFFLSNLYAVRAIPTPIIVSQPDGTQLTIYLKGDEHFHYKTTLDGYALTPDSNGILMYANIDSSGNFVSTNIKATDINKRSTIEKNLVKKLTTNFNLLKANKLYKALKVPAISNQSPLQKSYPLSGTPKSIVILVNFSDVKFVTPIPQTAFTNLLNQNNYSTNGGTGSAKDYFRANSMGIFNPQFDVYGPYTLPNTMAYYGQNDASGNDLRPQQMVIDACKLAAAAGVDFSQYDTDHNGSVDNVFIYYAGYNEAEGGPANSIWPHRWTLNNHNTIFSGVSIYDYACTSELRGNSGSNMCGVGTFCHEFGHVLGLFDLYDTADNTVFTLSYWDIMDSGPYLNFGRTPPYYSSYERFYLNWLVPTVLNTSGDFNMGKIDASNNAFLISPTGTHNLVGDNPSPIEFFMLENRQKTGWDTFLPGHGMLVTHINYNLSNWSANTVNNNPSALGVQLVEADGVGSNYTMPGDPFPGTSKVTSFLPILQNKTAIKKIVQNIAENNSIISFHWDSIANIVKPVATAATDSTYTSFKANWQPASFASGYYLTVYNLANGTSSLNQGFNNGLNPTPGWTINASNTTDSNIYSGTAPAIVMTNSGEYVETETYVLPVVKLSFFISSINAANGGFLIQGLNKSNSWDKIDSLLITSQLSIKNKNYTLDETKGYNRFKFTFYKSSNQNNYSISFDDVNVTFNRNLTYVLRDSLVTGTSEIITDMNPDTEYFYMLRSSQKNQYYENISDFSNMISAKTSGNVTIYGSKTNSQIVYKTNTDGTIILKVPSTSTIIYVYNLLGQQVIEPITPTSNLIEIKNLPQHQVYIIRVGGNSVKVVI